MRSFPYLFFIILFFYFINVNAQEDKKERSRLEEIFGKHDPDFDISEVPEKWKNESAVILAQKAFYQFDKFGIGNGKGIKNTELLRKRIMLMDKAAVIAFSEFYFISTNQLGIMHIKPGKEPKYVDLKQAVSVSSSVKIPTIYKSSYTWNKEYKKLAIPDLEPGDIIDYFYKVEQTYYLLGLKEFRFGEIILSLNNKYPAVKQKIEFEVEKQFFINVINMNGAPPLKEEDNPAKKVKTFSLSDEMREKEKDERWTYVYRSTPTIKFQVLYLDYPTYATTYFTGEVGKPKNSVTMEEVGIKLSKSALTTTNFLANVYSGNILKHLKTHHKTTTDPGELAKAAYYYFRHNRFGEGSRDNESYTSKLGDEFCAIVLINVFKARKIPYKLMVAVPRNIGTLDEVILRNELSWFIKVEGNKQVFIHPLSAISNLDDQVSNLEGTDAYEFVPTKDTKKLAVSRITLPVTTAPENNLTEYMEILLDDNAGILKVQRKTIAKGYIKDNFYNYILMDQDIRNDEKHLAKDSDPYKGLKPVIKEDRIRKRNAEAEEKSTLRLQALKNTLKDDFEVGSYDKFTLEQSGRSFDKKELVFSEEFRLRGLLKTAGKHYVIDAGKLIGGQVEIREDEMERNYDVFMSSARSYNYNISIVIPEGYRAEGLNKLNFNIDNDAGSFISNAKVEDGKIIISTSKVYKSNFVKKEDWSKMVAFLDAAFDFYNTKIVLKKI